MTQYGKHSALKTAPGIKMLCVCVCACVCVCVCVDLFFILHLLCCITVMSQKLQQKRNLNTTTNTNSAISIFTITNHNRHHQPNAIQPNNKTKYYSQTTKQSITAKQQNKVKDDDDFAFVIAGTFAPSLCRLR